MDTTNTSGAEASAADDEWQARDIGSDITGDELALLKQMCQDFGSEKAAWHALRRRKRLSEVIHDC